MKIEFAKSPAWSDVEFLTRQIDQDIKKLGRSDKIEVIGFFMKDEGEKIMGGCNGYTICGCIHIDQLWVHESLRGKGFGRKLMEAMHDYGRSLGFGLATLQTMDFQGKRSFYEHLGYECDLERPGYSGGTTLLCLSKKL